MARTASLVLVALLAFLGSGCDWTSSVDLRDYDPVVVVQNARAEDWPNAPKSIVSHRIEGDTLWLDASYSGGCRTHFFRLIVSSTFAESLPVQTWAVLAHDDRDDPCDAIVVETLVFDLTPLKEVYRNGYGPGSGDIVIHLGDLTESILYSF